MAKIYNKENKIIKVDLTEYEWSVILKNEWDYENVSYEETLENNIVGVRMETGFLSEILPTIDPIYPDGERFVEVHFVYKPEDILKLNPIAKSMAYPASCINENDYEDYYEEIFFEEKEQEYFTKLIQEAIGDKHTPEMKEIMTNYHNAIDKIIYDFVKDILHERDVLPITVGYISENQRKMIAECIGKKLDFAPRITMDADTVRHIIKRHGNNGKSDNSMTVEDISRMAYIIANFDEAEFGGKYSKKYHCADGTPAPHIIIKKQIDGEYYIVEAVTDAKSGRSHIVTAFIKNKLKN